MSTAWEEARRKGIGGSDWAQTTELGDRCTRALVLDKRGVEPDYPVDVEKQGYFDRGHALEAIVAELAEKDCGIKLRAPGRLPKTDLPSWWIGNPDRRIVGGGVWEGKTKGPFPFKALVAKGVPVGEVLQCNHYAALCKDTKILHSALEPVTWKRHHTNLEIDHALIDDMIVLGERIWKSVTEGPLPERLDAASKQCQACPWRWSCQGDALYKAAELEQDRDVIEVEEGDLLDIQSEILEIKALKKELGERESELNEAAKKIIGAPATVLVAGRAVHWIAFNRSSFDSARFRKEQPELAEKYIKNQTVEQMRWV